MFYGYWLYTIILPDQTLQGAYTVAVSFATIPRAFTYRVPGVATIGPNKPKGDLKHEVFQIHDTGGLSAAPEFTDPRCGVLKAGQQWFGSKEGYGPALSREKDLCPSPCFFPR